MSPTKNDDYLAVAVEAAIAASHIIMEALEKPRVADHKGKTDLVTETDHLSEKTIKSIIRASCPDHFRPFGWNRALIASLTTASARLRSRS